MLIYAILIITPEKLAGNCNNLYGESIMKKIIYYFTGTGNSLYIARRLSELIDGAAVKPIRNQTAADKAASVIGLVFPVYLWGLPEAVARFIESMDTGFDGKYIFAVASYKSQPGDTIGQTAARLKKRGIKLAAGFTVQMPGNNIIYYDADTKQAAADKLTAFDEALPGMAQRINNGAQGFSRGNIMERYVLSGMLHRLLTSTLSQADNKFWITPNCNGCGICKNVCPADNVDMSKGHPEWLHRCQQCLACIHTCPAKAIEFGKTTIGRERYLNPLVTVKDLMSE